MAVTAKVIKVLTTDFAEVAILDNGELSEEHYIAEFEGNKEKVRRDDYVEMVPKEGRIMNTSRWAYLLPVIGIIFAIFITADTVSSSKSDMTDMSSLFLYTTAHKSPM